MYPRTPRQSIVFLNVDQVNNNKLIGLEKVYPVLKEEWDAHSNEIEWRDFTDYQQRTIAHSHQGHEIDANEFNSAPIVQPNQKCKWSIACLLYTSPSPRDVEESRMPSSA